ncbi:MAG: PepSY domain-containing protein [Pseudotabrizicola sp.]|uniref:PepSY domain-containing protein n=1 Tax=Pseudotabrizicola sp. TaxID=2939647 RepID=UPI00271921BB|nr:PepSY domain-containing protein [Pseudotabrizicola sp.]MDO8882703.1 PepSY domain-containing protein [Pseudotabrizicola sp.]MDP2079728.1 PepSY domain-containing protein [Pseudotabrizicola sp.]MDZ7575685.1 PepSY domain-containing protein [Pseudotabrizicola sp.]
MTRILHRWPGLILAALLLVITLSGAALSVFPALEVAQAPRVASGLSVADLAARVQAAHPGVEQIKRAPSGQITAWWFDGGRPGSGVIDPATGQDIAPADPDPVRRWLTTLHRSLFLDDGGRLVAAIGAFAMLVLAGSGAVLVARRTGGWRRWFAPLRGLLAGRLHTELARVAVIGLVLSSATALWMAAETFDVVTIDRVRLAVPAVVSGETGLALASMDTLRAIPVAELRDLNFPAQGDATDTFILRTDQGMGYIDQGTGEMLAWRDLSSWQRVSETIYMLHTGEGLATLGLILGLMALSVPVMAVTGAVVWFAGWQARPRPKGNAPAAKATTVVLVGSEGGSTWGFADTLAKGLRAAGQSVHLAPMSGFDPARHKHAERFVILAATYGEGAAPASAKGFLERLAALPNAPSAPVAVLGFGDRSFPAYCAYAEAVVNAVQAKRWPSILPMDTVDRQSPQDFARWGRALGAALGIALELVHQPVAPEAEALTLISRRDYGAEVQVPLTILRFALPEISLWHRLTGGGFTRFQAGDLLGILPDGSPLPRLYSLASGSKDGFVEIVVRHHPGGLASGQLTALRPGQTVRGFLRQNPGFHAGRDRKQLILIGAGTGIGPLAGIVRANTCKRPVHLVFGLRDPASDFLYDNELAGWQADGRLARLSTAVSREGSGPRYVQDALRLEAAQMADAIRAGAKVMVCGGREMAQGVTLALADILQPMGMTPAMLKAEGRYVEDVY